MILGPPTKYMWITFDKDLIVETIRISSQNIQIPHIVHKRLLISVDYMHFLARD